MKDYKRLTVKSVGCFKYCLKNHKSKNGEFKYYDTFFDYSMAVKRLGELEDKIECGKLVEVPKGAVVLTPEERAEEMRLANEERKQVVGEFLKLLKEKESPKLLMWEYGEGYLDCIKMAEELAAKYGVEVKE